MSYVEEYEDWEKRKHELVFFQRFCTAMICEGERLGWPRVSWTPSIQAFYVAMRLDGESHHLAEMLALQQTPTVLSDNVFLEGHCNGSQFEKQPGLGEYYAAQARAAGVDPKGKIYLGGLARFPGDPEAWVASRGDVKSICERRGWGCEGAVSVAARAADEPPQETPIARDIVEDEVALILAKQPERAAQKQELVEATAEALTPYWAK